MNIPFVKYNNLGFITSSVLIVIACISLMFKGLNLGLDFTGGVSLEIKYDQRTYPNSALVGLRVDAEQFSNVPSRKYQIKGIESNRDQ